MLGMSTQGFPLPTSGSTNQIRVYGQSYKSLRGLSTKDPAAVAGQFQHKGWDRGHHIRGRRSKRT